MNSNGVLIGVFVNKKKVLSLFETLKNDFGVKCSKVFIHSIDTNNFEYLATFKTDDKDRFIGKLNGATVMHIKNGCLFSINALNKLIESEAIDKQIPNNEYVVNWERYKNKLILLNHGELIISNITKIEDISIFFN